MTQFCESRIDGLKLILAQNCNKSDFSNFESNDKFWNVIAHLKGNPKIIQWKQIYLYLFAFYQFSDFYKQYVSL